MSGISKVKFWHFEWIDNASCVVGRACDIHKQDVKVWEGVFGARRYLMLNLTPCNVCLWQIKADGFYRANFKDQCTPSFSPGTTKHCITLRRFRISEGISDELIHTGQMCSSLCRRGWVNVVYTSKKLQITVAASISCAHKCHKYV